MVQDVSGFLYGCHLILARSTLTASLGPEEAVVFDSKIHEMEGYSTFCLVSLTEKGSQTGVTLLERYKMLDKELTARDVERPVVEMTDNHVSRYSDEVMEFCKAHGIIQWSEESNTSAIFQAVDQNNQQCHVVYNNAKKEYKHELAVSLTHEESRKEQERVQAGGVPKEVRVWDPSEITVKMQDFITIVSRMWFS